MKTIVLACCAGMSTSLMVTKMQDAANKRGFECKIYAISETLINEHIDEADVLLLGPQVRFILPKVKGLCEQKNVPVDVIPIQMYGIMDGEKSLDFALNVLNKGV